MYDSIYFDLDDTLVKDTPSTGKSEILESGLEKYNELVKISPSAIKILLTNRDSKDIVYPNVYSFDEVVGKDIMKEYIEENIKNVSMLNLLSPLNFYLYIRGNILYKSNETPKLMYIFLRSILKKEKIYVMDDDKRVSGMFSKETDLS